jgi:hypothetical protein
MFKRDCCVKNATCRVLLPTGDATSEVYFDDYKPLGGNERFRSPTKPRTVIFTMNNP